LKTPSSSLPLLIDAATDAANAEVFFSSSLLGPVGIVGKDDFLTSSSLVLEGSADDDFLTSEIGIIADAGMVLRGGGASDLSTSGSN
jgi:hypothetical protein